MHRLCQRSNALTRIRLSVRLLVRLTGGQAGWVTERSALSIFEYEIGLVGRAGVEPAQLSRRFYRPLGSPRALCRPTLKLSRCRCWRAPILPNTRVDSELPSARLGPLTGEIRAVCACRDGGHQLPELLRPLGR